MTPLALRTLTVAMLATAAAPQARSEPTAPAGPPAFTNSHYGEDYGYLRDPANRTGEPWEAYKFVPLDAMGASFATSAPRRHPRRSSECDGLAAAHDAGKLTGLRQRGYAIDRMKGAGEHSIYRIVAPQALAGGSGEPVES